MLTKEECIKAFNHILYCDRDDHSYISDAYRNDFDTLLKLINEHFDNQFLDDEVEIMIGLLRPIEEELGMDITLLIDKLRRIQNTLPKEKGVVESVEFD